MGEVRYRTEASSGHQRLDKPRPLSGDRGLRDSSKTCCRPAGCPLYVWALGISECGGGGRQCSLDFGFQVMSPVRPDRRRWMSLGCCSPGSVTCTLAYERLPQNKLLPSTPHQCNPRSCAAYFPFLPPQDLDTGSRIAGDPGEPAGLAFSWDFLFESRSLVIQPRPAL